MDQVLIVSSGMENPKKRDNPVARRQQYLNYGALTLATILDRKGYKVKLIHGSHEPPQKFVDKLIEKGQLLSCYPLLLSIPSFYALSWAQKFCILVKKYNPSTEIVVGGRWTIDSDIDWIKKKLPLASDVISGLAEHLIDKIIERNHRKIISIEASNKAPTFNLNHHLVDDFEKFQPSIEASRGCGLGCAFCAERDIPLSPLKDPKLLITHLNEVSSQYKDIVITPYLQSSFFAPNTRWSEKLADAYTKSGSNVFWRCETRVDTIKPNTISALSQAGLKVIDLGMETASERQIIRMKKSKNPEKYLRSASDLLKACKENGIWVKLNFLLYAGETEQTYLETIHWLDEHRHTIKGISAGPVVIFGSPNASSSFINEVSTYGATIVDTTSSERTGIAKIHLSKEISAKDAEDLSIEASKRYMNKEDYFDLKSFSYYPRDYSLEDFNCDIENTPTNILPFSQD